MFTRVDSQLMRCVRLCSNAWVPFMLQALLERQCSNFKSIDSSMIRSIQSFSAWYLLISCQVSCWMHLEVCVNRLMSYRKTNKIYATFAMLNVIPSKKKVIHSKITQGINTFYGITSFIFMSLSAKIKLIILGWSISSRTNTTFQTKKWKSIGFQTEGLQASN